ncbi:MAG: S23 ribosomal protein [Candidatus Woesebacteria bacterium GW2011_GWC1_38_13]|uniref:S23 ribosomal protein n=1 Tax=Candidatus Woesebacteria bacterium GW2011_GWC1_38_13 TaxID=1618583 RepID=A0A0G0KXM3_9BACT|nr:MAG: S23 ribosomal protein [Candidatus Woesebacteria bacterium GW2011_GWC1_38_13]
MRTFRYLDFTVYKESKVYYRKCISITRNFSRIYWELKDQLLRAALSVCLNIAEGSAKYSDKDFKRYLENSLGSINECFACIDIAFENELISNEDFLILKTMSESVAKQLGGLIKKLRN